VKLFSTSKDGGKDSNVTGYWLIEWKNVFSVALLKFDRSSREAFHSHAFNSISWVLSGHLLEERLHVHWRTGLTHYKPSLKPIITTRNNTHKVYGIAPTTWVITFRGPWHKTWHEEFDDGTKVVLAHGRLPVLT
jgi:hypothetical protein